MVQYIYTLGAAGERLSVAELGRNVEYTYDNLYRLTGETITEGENVTAYTYSYDNVGNRILKTKNGAETVYTYNELNQLVSDSDATYEYDLNGNLVRVIGGAQAALYEYNSENKLVKATVQQGVNVVEETYTYDYAGNRTSKTTGTSDGNFEVVKYLNDNSSLTNVLAELDFEGNVRVYYTIGADLISQERNGRTYTYLYDGHGSVVGLMNEGGSVTDTYTYDAFGNLLKSTGRTANNYRYCGEQFDSTTGLYYLRARYMDTSTGRFISQDSYAGSVYDPVSLHKYLYANSNPVMYSDPSGYTASLLIDTKVTMAAMTIVAAGLIAYDNTVLNIGLSLINALKGIAYELNVLFDDLEALLADITNGNKTSADVNSTIVHDSLAEPFDNILITPFPIPEQWVESLPIPVNSGNSIFDPIPENEVYIEIFTLPSNKPWIETFPSNSNHSPLITTIRVPTTGIWEPLGVTEKEWLSLNGYKRGNDCTRPNAYDGEKSWYLLDKNGNVIGRIDHGFRINGANGDVTPPHVHLNTDSENVHHYFNHKGLNK